MSSQHRVKVGEQQIGTPHETKGSHFIAVQDNDQSNIKGGGSSHSVVKTNIQQRNQNPQSSDKFSASQGRTSQQLRQSMEENRKRNLVNVSQHIMSPNQ